MGGNPPRPLGGKPPTTPHSREAEALGGCVGRMRSVDIFSGYVICYPPSQNSLINNKFISIVYYIQRH